MTIIRTTDLCKRDLPIGKINWKTFSDFALTFDPINELLSELELQTISKMAPDQSHGINELRGFLYNSQRIWNHRSDDPDAKTWKTIESVIEWIRDKVPA